MKTRKLFLGILAAATVSLASCEHNVSPDAIVSQAAKDSFASMFPNAQNVDWRISGQYAVASFYLNETKSSKTQNREAWFNNGDGKWNMTEIDILFEELPQPVQDSFNAGEYATWRIEDIDRIDRDGIDILYIIEVEGAVDGIPTEVDLYYSPDGILIKEVIDTDDDYEGLIPDEPTGSITDYLNEHHPNARIIEIDVEIDGTEVEIIDNNIAYELFFDKNDAWVYTKNDVRYNEVPQNILDAFNASEYADAKIDDIEHYNTASKGEFYRFELDGRYDDVEIDIAMDGTITVVSGGNPGGNGDNTGNAEIESFINSKYPGATIIEIEFDDNYFQAEIRHENIEKDVYFNRNYEWVKTEWDVSPRNLPAAVTATIDAQYAGYEIDDVEYVESPEGEWYLIEMEKGDREIKVRIAPDGTVLQ